MPFSKIIQEQLSVPKSMTELACSFAASAPCPSITDRNEFATPATHLDWCGMNSLPSIRTATPADIPVLLTLIEALAVYEHLEHQFEATLEKLAAGLFGASPCAEAFMIEADGTVAGFALCFQNFSTFLAQPGLHLEDLFVKPEFRGRGYGKALLRYLARLAVDRGCGRFEWTVLDWNESSIGFYRKQGAEILPDWRICRVTGPALTRLATTAAANEP